MKRKTKKKAKTINKILNWGLVISIIMILLSSSFLIYIFLLRPAYVSYSHQCFPETYEEDFPNAVTEGTTTIQETGEVTVEIFIENPRIIKHETIHWNQFTKRNLPYVCSFGHYLIELEAYTFSRLPDSLFNLFYEPIENI